MLRGRVYRPPHGRVKEFPGVWNETPGKYFWQAQHTAPLCQAPHCEVISAMHSFRVVK